ncbi:unnamed protein product, partial [Rotaria sordida]
MFPWYWDEICGLADGSEILFEHLLVLNFANETRTALRLLQEKTIDHTQQEKNPSETKGCSTVLINRTDTNTFALLHNEDNTAGLYDTAFLVEADIKSSPYDGGTRHSPNERFLAYCYAGVIPGTAFGTNMHGFVFALNALLPNYIGENRIPRQIINRALLSVANENELDKLLHGTPIAFGFCINGTFFHADNNQQRYLLNYELGPNLNSNDNMTTKNFINDICIALNYLLHYNHYDRLQGLIVERPGLLSSRNRAQRGLEFGEIRTEKDALTLLGDRANKQFPIFMIPDMDTNNTATLLIFITIICGFLIPLSEQQYTPDWKSLDSRPLPAWMWWLWKGDKPNVNIVAFMNNNYPTDWTYADFAEQFHAELYDPNEWTDIFAAAGAKYIVFDSKHHEGFTMWPSKYSFNWNAMDVGPKRDLLGELANAIRNRTDIVFGLYHSMFEWFHPLYLTDKNNNFQTQFFPNVVNDRWGTGIPCHHGDFYTCTDRFNPGHLVTHKWENCFTIDKNSWGYIRTSGINDYLTIQEILYQIITTVSTGGNVLINVGPTSYGKIPPIYEERLRQMGSWLKVNGEAIYNSIPWKYQNDTINKNVWYTSSKDEQYVYACLLDWQKNTTELTLGAPISSSNTSITLLGSDVGLLSWRSAGTSG